MSRELIRVDSLCKRYRIGVEEQTSDSMVGAIGAILRRPLSNYRRVRNLRRFDAEESTDVIWALNGVSFDISAGETVGLIGPNGSGKSTLLKLLSRITAPTKGQIHLSGRVASMLEVGTGFHPELTGRENVFLNGAILGMRRAEIQRKFSEIVDFSGVGTFIDTPVKRYSSGMQVRLAFAVAAHLDPEILLVDEVLAVGDATFQQRCLNKMDEISSEGRAVVFVSHQLPSVARLCSRGIVLNKGQLIFDGDVAEALSFYGEKIVGLNTAKRWEANEAPGDSVVKLLACSVSAHPPGQDGVFKSNQSIEIRMCYEVFEAGRPIMPSIHVSDPGGLRILSCIDTDQETHGQPRKPGRYVTAVRIPENLMNEGLYSVTLGVTTMIPQQFHVIAQDALSFSVFMPDESTTSKRDYRGVVRGSIFPVLDWSTEPDPSLMLD